MDDKDLSFTWSGLFIVTACCCLAFAGIIRVVDGHFPRLLMIIGITALVLAVLNGLTRFASVRLNRKKQKLTLPD